MSAPPFAKEQLYEPLSSATQFAVMPFVGAVAGRLRDSRKTTGLRVVLHRSILRDRQIYLQQTSGYLGDVPFDPGGAGRILKVNEGIVGRAYSEKKIARTRYFAAAEVDGVLAANMKVTDDKRPLDQVAKTYLAIPMLTSTHGVAAVLFADAHTPNLFAEDDLVKEVVGMCRGFCTAMDRLLEHPLDRIRNLPIREGEPALAEKATVYPAMQEVLDWEVPEFQRLTTLNFEILDRSR